MTRRTLTPSGCSLWVGSCLPMNSSRTSCNFRLESESKRNSDIIFEIEKCGHRLLPPSYPMYQQRIPIFLICIAECVAAIRTLYANGKTVCPKRIKCKTFLLSWSETIFIHSSTLKLIGHSYIYEYRVYLLGTRTHNNIYNWLDLRSIWCQSCFCCYWISSHPCTTSNGNIEYLKSGTTLQ